MSFSKESKDAWKSRQTRDNLLRKNKDEPPRQSRSVKVNFSSKPAGQQHPLSPKDMGETSVDDLEFRDEGDWVVVHSPKHGDGKKRKNTGGKKESKVIKAVAPVEKKETDKEKLARLRFVCGGHSQIC